ncbi:MAG TPA: hypothetical protein DCR21_03930 [Succinivibrionaceae bacterium]|nr:hypothetical protein [Succinivibrionaceae bacterium]
MNTTTKSAAIKSGIDEFYDSLYLDQLEAEQEMLESLEDEDFWWHLSPENGISADKAMAFTIKAIETLSHGEVLFGKAFRKASFLGKLILAAEAANWAAKTISYAFYTAKACLIEQAMRAGVLSWVTPDEYGNNVVFLYEDGVGAASFHDPYGDVKLEGSRFNADIHYPWSGVTRQDQAFELLQDPCLLKEIAEATTPAELR